jgi:hypothetical protein
MTPFRMCSLKVDPISNGVILELASAFVLTVMHLQRGIGTFSCTPEKKPQCPPLRLLHQAGTSCYILGSFVQHYACIITQQPLCLSFLLHHTKKPILCPLT